MPITSPENPLIRQVRKLLASAKARRRLRQAVLDGWHLLEACLAAGVAVERVLLAARMRDSAPARRLLAHVEARRVALIADALFDALAPVEEATGVLTVIGIPHPRAAGQDCVLLLERIQDPGNLGSILRSAACAGADAVYLSKGCADVWSPRALRGGMGAQFHLALHEQVDLVALAQSFPGVVIATSLAAGDSLYDLDLRKRVAFAFGNEGAGLSPALLAAARHRVRIPMPGRVESLNAAAAAAVCLFERVRQLQAGR
jgi:TrmH family RNA methyltransferase